MDKQIIGRNTFVSVLDYHNIPAKIDTGADSSAIWVSNLEITPDNVLRFTLFAPSSPFYDGQFITTTDFKVVVTRSSHGDEKMFYRTRLPIVIDGIKINTLFTLADRRRNNFPILIGRRTISGKFLVDVSKRAIIPAKNPKTPKLNQELQRNPYQFHQKYGIK